MRSIILVLLITCLTIISCKKDEEIQPNSFNGVSGRSYTEVLLSSGHPPIMSGFVNDNNEYITFSIPVYSSHQLSNKIVDGELLTFDQNGLVSRKVSSFDAVSIGSTVGVDVNGQQWYRPSNLKASIAQYNSDIIISQNHFYGPQDFNSLTQIGNQLFYDIMALTEGPNNSLFVLVSSHYQVNGGNWQYIDAKIFQIDASGNTSIYTSIDSATAWFSGGGGGGSFNNVIYYHNHNTMDMISDKSGNIWIVSPFVDAIIQVNSNGVASKSTEISNPVSITKKGGYLYVLTAHMHDPNNYNIVKHPELWEVSLGGSKNLIHTFINLDYKFSTGLRSTPSGGGLLLPFDANFNVSIDNSNKFYLSSPVSGEVVLLK